MARTLTPAPTDRAMWRRLLKRSHPDSGGTHELFIWATALRDHVVGAQEEPFPRVQAKPERGDGPERIEFAHAFNRFGSFAELTQHAVRVGSSTLEPYKSLLLLLVDCYEAQEGPLLKMQCQGATYKSLAALAYKASMSKEQRVGFYRLAEQIPLSQRHVGHMISRLQEQAA
jgi:hypothetical protein